MRRQRGETAGACFRPTQLRRVPGESQYLQGRVDLVRRRAEERFRTCQYDVLSRPKPALMRSAEKNLAREQEVKELKQQLNDLEETAKAEAAALEKLVPRQQKVLQVQPCPSLSS